MKEKDELSEEELSQAAGGRVARQGQGPAGSRKRNLGGDDPPEIIINPGGELEPPSYQGSGGSAGG